MKEEIAKIISENTVLTKEEIKNLIEIPPNSSLGDFSFPCFSLAKTFKKSPIDISKELSKKINSDMFEKVEPIGPYVNFFIDRTYLSKLVLGKIFKEKDKYGSSKFGVGKTIVLDYSSPNIAKPFGIGHLRSTLIGNSIKKVSEFCGFKVIGINYLGDWGTPFGKIIAGYLKFGKESELKKNPIKHLYEIYVKVSKMEEFEELGRSWFAKLESNDKKAVSLWKEFRKYSLEDFKKTYQILGVDFEIFSGESEYNGKMQSTIESLKEKNLLVESDGALVVDLSKYNLGVCLIQKSDGTTLYATRDLTAAIDRIKKFKANYLFYEVGSEQKLHFQQFFKILELLGYDWAKECKHIDHGLYLDKDGKKFATRKGKTIFMSDVLEETLALAEKNLSKRAKLSTEELKTRALAITRAAIFYGDLKNNRSSSAIFDINNFLDFEGNTGPYLLYTYARAQSILNKNKSSKNKSNKIANITDLEKELVLQLAKFPELVISAQKSLLPNLIANYSFSIAQKFNEFYHSEQVLGSENESYRLDIVKAFSQVLKNSLAILGIETLNEM